MFIIAPFLKHQLHIIGVFIGFVNRFNNIYTPTIQLSNMVSQNHHEKERLKLDKVNQVLALFGHKMGSVPGESN
jgi:hypothetical protein